MITTHWFIFHPGKFEAYHAILLRDSVIVVEGIVDHAVLVVERLPVPDRQHFDQQQAAKGGKMSADEVELRRETRQRPEHNQHQGAAEDELQPRATHRRH